MVGRNSENAHLGLRGHITGVGTAPQRLKDVWLPALSELSGHCCSLCKLGVGPEVDILVLEFFMECIVWVVFCFY